MQSVWYTCSLPFRIIYWFVEAFAKLWVPNKYLKVKDIKSTDIALITGGASGIGREIGKQFALRGCKKIIIWDVNKDALLESQEIIQALGPQVWTFHVDVSDEASVLESAKIVQSTIGHVTYLVNNAGIVRNKPFLHLTPDDVKQVINVNAISHFWTVRAFLPHMLQEKSGHIITISSVASFIAAPFLSEYISSKFCALGLHSSLQIELKCTPGGEDINMTIVFPWAVATDLFKGVQTTPLLPFLDPAFVAESTLDAALANREYLVLPHSLRFVPILSCLMPSKLMHLCLRSLTDFDSIRDSIGRKKSL